MSFLEVIFRACLRAERTQLSEFLIVDELEFRHGGGLTLVLVEKCFPCFLVFLRIDVMFVSLRGQELF